MWEITKGRRHHTVVIIRTSTATTMINTWATHTLHLLSLDELNHPTSEVKLALQKPGSKDKLLELQA